MTASDPRGLKQEYAPRSWATGQPTGDQSLPDIVAVQGLASTYERTWTKQLQDGSRVMWLKDLLPKDLPAARILTFEYDSKWLDNPSHVSLRDCADRLIESVMWDRSHEGESTPCRHMMQRPLVLLGHSFGGLVIKMALVRAATILPSDPRYEYHRQFLTSVSGVVFLGTPHAGSNFATIVGPWARAWSVVGYGANLDLIRLLRPLETVPGGSDLQDLAEGFQSVQNEDYLAGLVSYYFWETKSVQLVGWDVAPVVSKSSACYGAAPECCFGLAANHKDMNKFGSRDDDNYQRVMKALSSICIRAHGIVEKRLGRLEYDGQYSGAHQKVIKEWLDPITLAGTIDKLQSSRLNGTCEWALSTTEIRTWLHPDMEADDKAAIWICGKPGSGKSVLSAYLNAQAANICRERARQQVSCQGIPKSPNCEAGLQGQDSLPMALYFPLEENQSITSVAATLIDEVFRWRPYDSRLQTLAADYIGRHPVITLTRSLHLLKLLLAQFRRTYITLDGFDECHDLTEFAQLLQAIHSVPGARLLLSGRRDEAFRIEMEQQIKHRIMTIDIAHHNRPDIETFTNNRLSAISDPRPTLYTPELRKEISLRIVDGSYGMFQWVNLILHDLRRHGHTKRDILEILEGFPSELDGAYTHTFARLGRLPEVKRRRAAITLKWLVSATGPMRFQDLKLAVAIGENLSGVDRIDLSASSEPEEASFDFLGALIDLRHQSVEDQVIEEYQGNHHRLVRLCHHSLQQWLDRQAHSSMVAPEIVPEFIFSRRQAHFQAATTCLRVLAEPDFIKEFFVTIYRPNDASAGFINYAGEYCAHHLRMCGPLIYPDTNKALSSAPDSSLLVLSELQLQRELELTATTIAALSSAFRQIDGSSVKHLVQLIALRDIQIELVEAAKRVRQIHQSIPQIRSMLENLSNRQLTGNTHLDVPWINRLSPSSNNSEDESLNRDLQTPDFSRAEQRLRDHDEACKTHLETFGKASTTLRRVCIFLSAEPVRTYTYQLVGDSGLSPIPLLAHCATSLDTFLVSATTPASTTPAEQDFRCQLQAPSSHPLFGHIMAARFELSEKRSRIVGPDFYKRYILEHYRIRSWERNLLHLSAIALDMHVTSPSDPTSPVTKDVMLEHWLTNQVKIRKQSDQSPGSVIAHLKTRNASSRRSSISEICSAVAKTSYIMFVRLLTFLSPNLQTSATNAVILARARGRLAIPLLRGLFTHPTPLAIAVGLYAVRCQRSPFLFASPRSAPLTDLAGVLRDPVNYVAGQPPRGGRMTFMGWLLRETFFGLVTFVDAVRTIHPELKPYIIPSSLRKLPSKLLGPASEMPLVKTVAKAFLNFWRIIFLERTVFHTLYLGYDIIKASAMLLAPKTSVWVAVGTYTSLYLPVLIRGRYGVAGLFLFIAQVLAGVFVWDYLARTPIVAGPLGHIFRRTVALLRPAFSPVTGLLDNVSFKVAFTIAWARQGSQSLSPAALALLCTPIVMVLLYLFVYAVTDPLHMRYARTMSEEAERIAIQVSCVKERPAQYLGWRQSRTVMLGNIPYNEGLFES